MIKMLLSVRAVDRPTAYQMLKMPMVVRRV